MRISTASGLQHVYGRFYVVQYGDSLYSIAQKFNLTMTNLLYANEHIDTNVIHPGEVLFLPNALPANSSKGKTGTKKKNVRKKKK